MGCKEEGYQRIVKEKKIKEIVAYLSGKSSDSYPSILPSNILIALDNYFFVLIILLILGNRDMLFYIFLKTFHNFSF